MGTALTLWCICSARKPLRSRLYAFRMAGVRVTLLMSLSGPKIVAMEVQRGVKNMHMVKWD